jgi:predicted DNA-binding transcriptional regulator YafY
MSILFEIESRPGITAEVLASELGVSVRTIYRDVTALQTSGVPVYGMAGRGGGLRLVEGYRSRSAGLRADEAAALLIGVVPAVAQQLGLSEPLARAERKVFAQLGNSHGSGVDVERAQILVDPIGWYRSADEAPHLRCVASALRTHTTLIIRYRRWQEPTLVRRRIEPHGIVLKAGVWYVMARSRRTMRTYRINQIVNITPTTTSFVPDPTFDLPAAWDTFLDQFRDRLNVVTASVRLTRTGRDWLRAEGDPAITAALAHSISTGTDDDQPQVVQLPFESIERAASDILRLGLDAEAIDPPELVEHIARTVTELDSRYHRHSAR